MYYDLVTSLPHLPHFEQAERLPITRPRLAQRLRMLRPEHADQLTRAESLVRWRPDHWQWRTDAGQAKEYATLMASAPERPLREYVAFRMEQQTLMAALRRKQAGLGAPERGIAWGVGPRVLVIVARWDEPDFGLAAVYPWLPEARRLLAACDARGLERSLMGVAWRQLVRHAERDMFSFEAVFAYVFQWDILQAWLACDADKGRTRFRELIDEVTHADRN